MAMLRSRSWGRPSAERTRDASSVKITKATASPTAMPSGRRRPPVVDAAATTGSTGSTQGDRNVASPATAATAINVTSTCDVYAARSGAGSSVLGIRREPGKSRPRLRYVAARGLSAARARAAGHGLRERGDVVGAVVAAAVDEEGRRARDAAQVGAVDVLGDPPRAACARAGPRGTGRRRGRAPRA